MKQNLEEKLLEPYANAPPSGGLFSCKKKPEWHEMPERMIYTNVPDMQLPNNKIETSKYNLLTFLPKNLFEQFRKLANIYFLVIGGLQMISEISNSDGQPVIWLPLLVIVLITMVKDLVEDFKRHKSDREENTRITRVLRHSVFVETSWENIRVGDVIKVNQNEYFPADCLLIKSSELKGMSYIETKNLDGETNLKHKKVHKDFTFMDDLSDEEIYNLHLKFNYEKPNPYLYSFSGTMLSEDGSLKMPNDQGNFILRGCSLRNTKYIYGVVAYCGHDTKIMLNSVKARAKSSKVETSMNTQIVIIFGVQLLFCIFSALYAAIWYQYTQDVLDYLEIGQKEFRDNNFFYNFFVRLGSWLMIFTNLVPISLLVTLEMVKFIQGIKIYQDKKLVCVATNTPVTVQSSNLNEELGQVEYIFSDKTGTLTCNFMEFKNISINGTSYGDNRSLSEEEHLQKPSVTNVDFRDGIFFTEKADPRAANREFIRETLIFLASCHTIITEEKNGEITYNASSPDELALVNFAKYCGAQFLGLDESNFIRIKLDDEIFKFQLLQTLEFNSTRKRMSVILRDEEGKIILYTKGADTIIEQRLSKSNEELWAKTWKNLEKYAVIGLRTLVLAKRVVPQFEYDKWAAEYLEACSAIENREEKMMEKQELIEVELDLLGATAIEDKLQDEVGDTISSLKKAGIKIWVLTGDKIETAINIGYSCKLISDDLEQILVDGREEETVKGALNEGIEKIKTTKGKDFALIITGDALIVGMKPMYSSKIMEIGEKCKAVIACRVSPKQKQEVVSLVRREVSTLAIGDGANDVNMITAAHVGIGIRGVEGQQAARASDYAIGEFKLLKRLLLYHGRESYRKNSLLICYNFFKNVVLVMPNFWYAFINGFSGVLLYDPWIYQFFNIFYASLPIVIFAILDKEYTGAELEKNPFLYTQGLKGLLFNKRNFWLWIFQGFWQSCLLCFTSYYAVELNFNDQSSGQNFFFSASGMVLYGSIVTNCNLKIFLFTNEHSFLTLFCIFGSILFYISNYVLESEGLTGFDVENTFHRVYGCANFWWLTITQIVGTTYIDMAISRFLYYQSKEASNKELRELKKLEAEEGKWKQPLYSEEDEADPRQGGHSGSMELPENFFLSLNQSQNTNKFKSQNLQFSIRRKYTGYGFSQDEPLDYALRHAEN